MRRFARFMIWALRINSNQPQNIPVSSSIFTVITYGLWVLFRVYCLNFVIRPQDQFGQSHFKIAICGQYLSEY